ncbi:MAG: energy transducer TonB [Prevotella sp.]|nr:energy transducer TonB [Prevotella sp.]MCM1074794.1 energy transducer TonB [Ruminococcus sp.]
MTGLVLLAAALLSAPQTETPEVNVTYIGVVNNEQPSEQVRIKKDGDTQNDRAFTAVEQQASFPGGMSALMSWLAQNLKYPTVAAGQKVQGRVIVRFIVEKDGSITSAEVMKGVDPQLDKEALRVVKAMPKWIPARNGGDIVRCFYTLPISFKLSN